MDNLVNPLACDKSLMSDRSKSELPKAIGDDAAHALDKVGVEGANPFARSNFSSR